MFRLTIVERASDGMPLAQGVRYVNEQSDDLYSHKEMGEFLLKEIARGALPHSRMTIFLDHHYFNCLVDEGVCFMVMCDELYPRKLAFHYLQDLQKEFKKFDVELVESIIRPYSFIKFDGVIGNFRRKYIDTRTQANISKIKSDSFHEEDIVSENFSQVVIRRQRFDMFSRMSKAHLHASSIWCSERLEVIALKWIPLGLILTVTFVLTCTGLHRVFYSFQHIQ